MAKEKSARIVVRWCSNYWWAELAAGDRQTLLVGSDKFVARARKCDAVRIARWWAKELDLPVDVEE